MDHTLSVKTAKFTSLENLYEYGIPFRNQQTKEVWLSAITVKHNKVTHLLHNTKLGGRNCELVSWLLSIALQNLNIWQSIQCMYSYSVSVKLHISDAPIIGQISDIGLIGTKTKLSVSVKI